MLKTMLKIGPVCMQLLHNVHAMENFAVLKTCLEIFDMFFNTVFNMVHNIGEFQNSTSDIF